MQHFPSFSKLRQKLHYILYEQPLKPRKILQNQFEIMIFAAFAFPTAYWIVWQWFGNFAQYNWVLLVGEAVVAPYAVVNWVRHRKERAEERNTFVRY